MTNQIEAFISFPSFSAFCPIFTSFCLIACLSNAGLPYSCHRKAEPTTASFNENMDCRAHLCSLEASGEKLCVFGSPCHCAFVDVATRVSCSAHFPFAVRYVFLNPILKFASKSIFRVILDFLFD